MKKLHELWGKARQHEYDKTVKRQWGCFESMLREYFDQDKET